MSIKGAPLLDSGRAHWRDEPVTTLRCTACVGWGTVSRYRPRPEGWITCPDCDGTGRLEVVRAKIRQGDGDELLSTGRRDDG